MLTLVSALDCNTITAQKSKKTKQKQIRSSKKSKQKQQQHKKKKSNSSPLTYKSKLVLFKTKTYFHLCPLSSSPRPPSPPCPVPFPPTIPCSAAVTVSNTLESVRRLFATYICLFSIHTMREGKGEKERRTKHFPALHLVKEDGTKGIKMNK